MMRRRPHCWLTMSLVMVAYFQGMTSAANTAVSPDDVELGKGTLPGLNPPEEKERIISPWPLMEPESLTAGGNKAMKGLVDEEDEDENKNQTDGGYSYVEYEETVETRGEEIEKENFIPTMRPRRINCTPPAIEQFPRPLMSQHARSHGGLIIHALLCVFTFIGLAIVCNEYFVFSLGRICEELKLAPDVAGATFMAAGSSAPKLATVIIAVFFAKDDIGTSEVIGSAVFKIMFVISVCALCAAGTVSHLNWWPLYRDCFFFAISILVMLYITANGYVSWPEALFMLMMYGVYCIALRFNSTLERWAMTLPLPFKHRSAGWQPAPPAAAGDGQYLEVERQTKETALQNAAYNPTGAYENAACNADPTQAWDDADVPAAPAHYKAKEYNPETAVNPLIKPENANLVQLVCYYVAYPVHWSCRHTMPDCRGRWYPVTFIVSMLWISFYSYFMVWMITIIGSTLSFPDSLMGLTFVAAGVSVPGVVSSLAIIKEGYGDMAVSNAVGSNVFDILVCLGLPWFIQTAIIQPGSYVNVISKSLIYSTLSLFSIVIFLVVATHATGWKLDRKYGAVLMVWYLLFVTFANLYELNVFGNFFPPECMSFY